MPMAEYIEREALIAAYDAAHKGEPGGARKLIVDAPAADVVPVVHGRWGWKDHYQNGYYLYTSCVCSVCGGCPPVEYRFCPHCGARMDGE
jgi:hypothetical protein